MTIDVVNAGVRRNLADIFRKLKRTRHYIRINCVLALLYDWVNGRAGLLLWVESRCVGRWMVGIARLLGGCWCILLPPIGTMEGSDRIIVFLVVFSNGR